MRARLTGMVLIIWLMFPAGASAGFFDEGRQGWFWYEDPEIEEEVTKEELEPEIMPEDPEPEIEVAEPEPEPERPFDGFQDIDWEGVWNMHPDDFQDLVDDTQAWAVQDPSVERVRVYVALQNVGRERSKRFQEAWKEALLADPVLRGPERHPSHQATRLTRLQEREDRQEIIPQMKEDMGILFFYTDDCPMCEAQFDVLEYFKNRWDWKNIETFHADEAEEVLQEHRIHSVPETFVVGKVDGEIKERRLATGYMQLAQIERGLLNAHSRWFEDRPYESPQMSESMMAFDDYIEEEFIETQKDLEDELDEATDLEEQLKSQVE